MIKNEKSEDYGKADLKQRVLFFITIFRLAIPAFFRFTSVYICPSEISGSLNSLFSLLFCYLCLSDHLGVGIISGSIWGSLRGYCVSIQWLPRGFFAKDSVTTVWV